MEGRPLSVCLLAIADARERVVALLGVVLKCNEREALALAGPSAASQEDAAALLCERTGARVFVTPTERRTAAAC